MDDVVVHCVVERAIATVTLDDPQRRNALSARLVEQLAEHLQRAGGDPGVRAVVITHTGSTFSAGADLKESAIPGGPARGTARTLALLQQIVELPKPVVARVDGHVRAGGIGVVAACDIAVVGPAATFAFTEVRLGVAPALISLITLNRMTERATARYFLTGETFPGQVAAATGLATAAVEDTEAEVATICDALRLGSPQGLAESKSLTTARTRRAIAQLGESTRSLSQRLFESTEAAEGMQALREKRPPSWAAG